MASAQEINWSLTKIDREKAATKLSELKKQKKSEKAHRIDRNTVLLLPDNLTDEQVRERIQHFKDNLERNRSTYR